MGLEADRIRQLTSTPVLVEVVDGDWTTTVHWGDVIVFSHVSGDRTVHEDSEKVWDWVRRMLHSGKCVGKVTGE